MTVGQLLRKARAKSGRRQRDIADDLGCTQVAVQGWESDKWHPENDRVRAVAAAYKVDPVALITLIMAPPKAKKKRRAA